MERCEIGRLERKTGEVKTWRGWRFAFAPPIFTFFVFSSPLGKETTGLILIQRKIEWKTRELKKKKEKKVICAEEEPRDTRRRTKVIWGSFTWTNGRGLLKWRNEKSAAKKGTWRGRKKKKKKMYFGPLS
jgi:hypothetical protein